MSKEVFENKRKGIETFLMSDWFMWISFLVACIITTFRIEVAGLVVFALIISVALVFCEDIIVTLEPFLLLCVCLIKCFNSYNIFIKMWWAVLPAAAALIFHFNYYKKKHVRGELLWPMIAVSVAVTLGGVGIISTREYFSLESIFYTLGLGFGMVYFYVLMNSHIQLSDKYSLADKFSKIMIMMGLFCCFMIAEYYLVNIQEVIETRSILAFQWRNNASTFLLFALPFAFWRSYRGNHAWIWAGLAFFGFLMLTGSRGGAIVGVAEVAMCMIALLCFDKRHRLYNILIILGCFVAVIVFFWDLIYFFRETLMRLLMIDDDEIRVQLMKRAVEDFKSNPVFGRGLAYFGNRDVHHSAKFALCWYHSSPFQIIGSFGIVGVIAYTYQFIARMRFYARRRNVANAFILITYIGIELMSLVNPGLFSPVPYLMMATIMFVVMDKISQDPEQQKIGRKSKKIN